MTNLIGTKNVGYIILKQGKKSVIGYSETKKEYVAWSYHITEDKNPSYYWGHYLTELADVDQAFDKKEA